MLTKIRLFDADDNFVELTFSIVLSSGTSEQMFHACFEDFVQRLRSVTRFTKEQAETILKKKCVGGVFDRASKIQKMGKIMKEKCENYTVLTCDNHVTETAWQNTQKAIKKLEGMEDVTKLSFKLLEQKFNRKKYLEHGKYVSKLFSASASSF